MHRSASRLGNLVAHAVFDAFVAERTEFLRLTAGARASFERRDWAGQRLHATRRLTVYGEAVAALQARLRGELGPRADDRLVLVGGKAVFSGLIAERPDWDLAETFWNSSVRVLLGTVGVDPLVEFLDSDFDEPPRPPQTPLHRTLDWPGALHEQIAALLREVPLSLPWLDLRGDAARVADRVAAQAPPVPGPLAVLREPFFVGKGAYVVARLPGVDGPRPLVLALRNGPRGVFVDAALLQEADVSMLFSFTRSYFHVLTARPWDVVAFLRTLLPRKPKADLYISLGHIKQGKTELFRDLKERLQGDAARFERAPGTPGLVMACFGMEGWGCVVKVVRDRFPDVKTITPDEVRARYAWVHLHDRAGRLVDAQEFRDMRLPLARFEPSLRDELLGGCSHNAWVDGDDLILRHAYVERRLTPMNLVLQQADTEGALRLMAGYADALADLAACGIFPGDLLLKNFGVTRHGRVAFYDYDELVPLSRCRFRDLPQPQTPEQELASEPWYTVGPDDVFPEEFPRFLGLPPPVRARFLADRGEVFTAAWWRGWQEQEAAGKVAEFVPYRPELRLGAPQAR